MEHSSYYYISAIKIQNLFGDRQLSWQTLKDVNILGGTNGSGKSTVLKACYALLKDGCIKDEKLSNLLGAVEIDFANGSRLKWERVKIQSSEYQREEGFDYYLNDKAIGRDGFLFLQRIQVQDSTGERSSFSEWSQGLDVYLINSFEQKLLNPERIQTLQGNDRTYLDFLIHEQISRRNAIFARIMEENLRPTGEGVEISELLKVKDVKNFFLFYSILQSFLKNYKVLVDSRLTLKRNGYSATLSYEDLSMGEKQLILLLLMVSNTAQAPCIFFMDEPDLGMHVEWKEILIRKMRAMNPHMQILLSTHAPSMIEGWQNRVKEMGQITSKN